MVAGVLVYNRLQERGVRREAERSFGSRHADVLLDEAQGRKEPTFDLTEEPRLEPAFEPASSELSPEPPGARPDARIDYVVEVQGVPLAALRSEWAPLEHRFADRVRLCAGSRGTALAALQMASRSGVVGEAELVDFRARIESVAAAHGGSVSAPQVRTALEAAQALDKACAEVDVQIALHVLGIPPAEMPEGRGFQVARRTDGITLLIDVPRTAELVRTFDDMVNTAQRTASVHGGRLVDDNGNPLGQRALAAIGVEVQALRARLAELGIEPGSPLALRLFS